MTLKVKNKNVQEKGTDYSLMGSWKRSSGFLRIFTVAFFLFQAPDGKLSSCRAKCYREDEESPSKNQHVT